MIRRGQHSKSHELASDSVVKVVPKLRPKAIITIVMAAVIVIMMSLLPIGIVLAHLAELWMTLNVRRQTFKVHSIEIYSSCTSFYRLDMNRILCKKRIYRSQ